MPIALFARCIIAGGLFLLLAWSLAHACRYGRINAAGTWYDWKKQRFMFFLTFAAQSAFAVFAVAVIFTGLF